MKYLVSIGFKHWMVYQVSAKTKCEAKEKALEKYCDGEKAYKHDLEPYPEIDEICEVKK